MDEAVVLYPSPAIGHLISMVELGKLILSYRPSFSIHILIIAAPYSAGSTASYISLLPHGFLDRTKKRGLVVKSWAPQVAVLNHNSVGGFVTHCGWYSVLESVCAGVPMVAWPLYAEQRFNRIVLVEEMKIALPMNESDNGFVTASEVEKRVSELMNSEIGNSVRKRTISFKYAAEKALSEDGSSRVALSKLVESWKRE